MKKTMSEQRLAESGDRTPLNIANEIKRLKARRGGRGAVAPQIAALRLELVDLVGEDWARDLLIDEPQS